MPAQAMGADLQRTTPGDGRGARVPDPHSARRGPIVCRKGVKINWNWQGNWAVERWPLGRAGLAGSNSLRPEAPHGPNRTPRAGKRHFPCPDVP
jgi:hypothetical protein